MFAHTSNPAVTLAIHAKKSIVQVNIKYNIQGYNSTRFKSGFVSFKWTEKYIKQTAVKKLRPARGKIHRSRGLCLVCNTD